MKDWIDGGESPIFSHWLGYVAQSGHPSAIRSLWKVHPTMRITRFTVGQEETVP